MYSPTTISVPRPDDYTVYTTIRNICKECSLQCNKLDYTYLIKAQTEGSNRVTDINRTLEKPLENFNVDDFDHDFAYKDSINVRSFVFRCSSNITLTFSRHVDDGRLSIGSLDTLTIENASEYNDKTKSEYHKIIKSARTHFRSAESSFLPSLIEKDLSRYYSARENSLQRLESKIAEVVTFFAEFRLKQEKQLAADKAAYEENLNNRLTKYEQQYSERVLKLDEREKQLEERKQSLDDRASKHARRETYKEIKKILEGRTKKFGLTKDTTKKRNLVHAITLIGIASVAGLFGYCFYLNSKTTEINWVIVVSQFGLAVGLATLLTFYIRWQNQWFKEHANEELRLQKLDLDIDRATWLVELAMEWKNETKVEMPVEMLNKLSQSLFTDSERSTDMHPLESLISGLIDKKGELIVKPSELQVKRGSDK